MKTAKQIVKEYIHNHKEEIIEELADNIHEEMEITYGCEFGDNSISEEIYSCLREVFNNINSKSKNGNN